MEAEMPAPTPIMEMGLVLDPRVTQDGQPGLSLNCTFPGEEPRKKTTGPFMSEADKKQVMKLLEEKGVFVAFKKVKQISDLQNVKNPFPDITTPGLTWITMQAIKTWTAMYRMMEVACVLEQYERRCGDYLVKVINHLQRNRDKATSKERRFNYILCEPGLAFDAYKLVAEALELRLLTPPDPPQPTLVTQQAAREESVVEQLFPVLKTTPSVSRLREKAQQFLDQLPPEQQSTFLSILGDISQEMVQANMALEPGTTKGGRITSVDDYIADPTRVRNAIIKGTAIEYMKPDDDNEDNDALTDTLNDFKPESNFLKYFMTSMNYKDITPGSVKRYTTVKNFMVKYFKRIKTLKYETNGDPKLTFTYIGRRGKKGKPGTLKAMMDWMIQKKYSDRTIVDYLGLIRSALLKADDEGIISGKFIPFGPGKEIQIERPAPLERAVGQEILQYIFRYPASTKAQKGGWSEALAKNTFLISFVCYGMPITDIFRVPKEQLMWDHLEYYRNKRKKSKGKLPIVVPKDDFLRSLCDYQIKLLGEVKGSPFAFAGLELTKKDIAYLDGLEADEAHGMTKEEVYERELEAIRAKKVTYITRKINYHFKKIVAGIKEKFNVDFDFKVTSYVARHDFVAWAKTQPNISTLVLSREMLGHESLETVNRNYGFDGALKIKQEVREKMVNSMQMGVIVPNQQADKTPEADQTPAHVIPQELPKAS